MPASVDSKNLLIVDECLRDRLGHHAGFVTGLAELGASAGMAVEVWAHQAAQPGLLAIQATVKSVFPDCWIDRWWRVNRWRRSWDWVIHNLGFLRTMLKTGRGGPAWEIVIGSDVNIMHLVAWRLWLWRSPPQTRLYLFLIQPPWLLKFSPQSHKMELNAQAWLYRIAIRLFKTAVRDGRCRFASDSSDVARLIETYGGGETPTMRIPRDNRFMIATSSPPPNPAQGLRLGFLGRPTSDRGFGELVEAIELWINEYAHGSSRLQFVVQWHDCHGANPDHLRRLRQLVQQAPKRVTIMDEPLDDANYARLISSLHGGIIPSRRSEYFNRPSNVAQELMCAGRPLITTQSTLVADRMQMWGAGLTCDETAAALTAAILQFENQYNRLATEAWAHRSLAKAQYSWDQFSRFLHLAPPTHPDRVDRDIERSACPA